MEQLEYNYLGIEVGKNPRMDLKLTNDLKKKNIQYEVTTIDINDISNDCIIINFSSYYRLIRGTNLEKFLIRYYFFSSRVIRNKSTVVYIGKNLNEIVNNDFINLVFSKSTTMVLNFSRGSKNKYIHISKITPDMIDNGEFISLHYMNLPENKNHLLGLKLGLVRGLFFENPYLEKFLYNELN